jgi:hypothetical protein
MESEPLLSSTLICAEKKTWMDESRLTSRSQAWWRRTVGLGLTRRNLEARTCKPHLALSFLPPMACPEVGSCHHYLTLIMRTLARHSASMWCPDARILNPVRSLKAFHRSTTVL